MKYISINKDRDYTINKKSEYFLDPEYIYIPLINNDLIVKGNQVILIDDAIFLNNFYYKSSVSGTIKGIKTINKNKYIVIENNYKEKSKTNKKINSNYSHDKIIEKLNDYSLNKLAKKLNKKCNNIIINTLNDEPYISNNIYMFKENLNDILELIDFFSNYYNSKNTIIVIKAYEKEGIEKCLNTIRKYPNIKINLVNDLYLLEQDYFINDYLGYSNDDTLNLNIKDLLTIINIYKYNQINSLKTIIILGDAIKKGCIINAKKYVKVSDIVNKYIKIIDDDYVCIVNGLMTGYISNLEDLILTDDIDSIFIMKKNTIKEKECINCGLCYNVCPLKINPVKSLKSKRKNPNCLNCGLCTYICPSFINLRKYLKGDE